MIKVKQKVDFNCDYAGAGYDLENLEFCDNACNHVVIDFCNPTELPRLGLKILDRAILLAMREKKAIDISRDDLFCLLRSASEYLEVTKPVES